MIGAGHPVGGSGRAGTADNEVAPAALPPKPLAEKRREAWFRRSRQKMKPPGAWTLDPDFDEEEGL